MPNSRTLRVSQPAARDLADIGAYTQQTWGAAQKRIYLGLMRDAFKALRDVPAMGAPRDDIMPGLRAHPVQSHIVFYRETDDELLIVRVLHKSMDHAAQL